MPTSSRRKSWRCPINKRLLFLSLSCCVLVGCQQKMASQPSHRPDEPSTFFCRWVAAQSRPVVQGTIARGHLQSDRHLFVGKRRPEEVARTEAANVGWRRAAIRFKLHWAAVGLQ